MEHLTTLRAAQTTVALTRTVGFVRDHNVDIDSIRMDSQKSADLLATAKSLRVRMEYVSPAVHQPNRAERAIRTAKNHIIASRAGFNPDCPTTYLDKCIW